MSGTMLWALILLPWSVQSAMTRDGKPLYNVEFARLHNLLEGIDPCKDLGNKTTQIEVAKDDLDGDDEAHRANAWCQNRFNNYQNVNVSKDMKERCPRPWGPKCRQLEMGERSEGSWRCTVMVNMDDAHDLEELRQGRGHGRPSKKCGYVPLAWCIEKFKDWEELIWGDNPMPQFYYDM